MAELTEEILTDIRTNFSKIKVAASFDKVYKSQCVYSFDTPLSDTGLYVSLSSWQAVGEPFLKIDQKRTNCGLYVHIKQVKVPKKVEETESKEAEAAPTKVAIGMEGGFNVDDMQKYTTEETVTLAISRASGEMVKLAFPNPDLPTIVIDAANGVINHAGFDSTKSTLAAWEEEEAKDSKYAKDLVQLDNGKKLSPDASTWKCDETGVTENLWLNLSTGFIGSGRKQWDGSGGNGAAERHFEATGSQYPLCVKLGTITAQGADVFSYAKDEQDMVLDPLLGKHMAHWGINVMGMEKTVKSLAEMQVDLNLNAQLGRIEEAGKKLEKVFGAGFVGLKNLGNTCYMNSMMQILFALPEMKAAFYTPAGTMAVVVVVALILILCSYCVLYSCRRHL
jgi:ubiquitin carboxyl-terminal hydrolase 5/13